MGERHIVRLVNAGKAKITGVFDTVAQITPQKLHEPAVKNLRPGPNHDALRVNLHAAKATQVACNRDSQTLSPGISCFPCKVALRFTRKRIPHRFRPRCIRKQAQRNRSACEIGDQRLSAWPIHLDRRIVDIADARLVFVGRQAIAAPRMRKRGVRLRQDLLGGNLHIT